MTLVDKFNKICLDFQNRENSEHLKYLEYFEKVKSVEKIEKIEKIKRIRKPTIKCNENYFEEIDTPAKAFYLGFIAGDGHICEKDNVLFIGLAIKDEQFLIDFLKALDSEHSIYKKKTFLKKTQKTYEGRVIKICRPKIVSDLIKHGVGPNKSKELSISPTIPENLVKHFIRGIIDSDGCWSIDKIDNRINCSFLSSIESFSVEISNILINKCQLKSVKILPRPGCFETRWCGNIPCKRIYDYLYSDGGPYLQRKYDLSTNHFKSLNL